jgi:hypothetical protein
MPAKKAAPTKTKGKSAPVSRKRNPEGVSRVWGGGDQVKSADGSKNGGSPRRKRNPAPLPEDTPEAKKARELTFLMWQQIYAKRDRFGKVGED